MSSDFSMLCFNIYSAFWSISVAVCVPFDGKAFKVKDGSSFQEGNTAP